MDEVLDSSPNNELKEKLKLFYECHHVDINKWVKPGVFPGPT